MCRKHYDEVGLGADYVGPVHPLVGKDFVFAGEGVAGDTLTALGSAMTGFDYAGRRVLVTGATSGIGLAVAHGFAAAGAQVTAIGLGAADAPPADGVDLVEGDVTAPGAVEAAIAGHDRLDAAVCFAGIIRRDDEHDPEVFAASWTSTSPGRCGRSPPAATSLTASSGAAVATASMLSYVGGPRVPAYAASKGGVVALVRSLAVAWAPPASA